VYVDGVEDSFQSTSIGPHRWDRLRIGGGMGGGNTWNGWIDAFVLARGVQWTAAFTPPSSAPTVADWYYYDINAAQMYQATAESSAAGSDPTFTAANYVCVGEVVTGASSVSAVLTYAYRGQYSGRAVQPAVNGTTNFNHNIGLELEHLLVRCGSDEYGESTTGAGRPGERLDWTNNYWQGTNAHGYGSYSVSRTQWMYKNLSHDIVSSAGSSAPTMAYRDVYVSMRRAWD
jgi:hypothetical protein